MDVLLLRRLEVGMIISEKDKQLSKSREISYDIQFEEYRQRMKAKYGLDGGPSPCIIFGEPFKPHE